MSDLAQSAAGFRPRLVRACAGVRPGPRVVLLAAVLLALAHYAFGEWIFHRNPPFRRALNLWLEPAFWADMPWVAAVPVLMWLAWVIISMGRVNAARALLLTYAGVFTGDWVWFLVWRQAARLGVKVTPDSWYWWTRWLPVALVIGNAVIAAGWWKQMRRHAVVRPRRHLTVLQLSLRAIACCVGGCAALLAAVHLVVPQLVVSDFTLGAANEFLLRAEWRSDFEFMTRSVPWRGKRIGALLEHVKLANLQRNQFYTALDSATFQQFVLSPLVDTTPVAELDWRRTLWAAFYPTVRGERDPSRAARLVVRGLREHVGISPDYPYRVGVETIWTQGMTDEAGFERVYVAALRSVGIAARLDDRKQAEFLADGKWQPAPRPLFASLLDAGHAAGPG
jgi:hypothetical protein